MILLESIIDGIRDIKDHLGRTMLQLVGIILGAGSIVATFSLSVAGKAASMEYYRVSGGIQKIWIWDKPTGKVTLDAKALASKGLTFRDAMAIKNNAKEIDLLHTIWLELSKELAPEEIHHHDIVHFALGKLRQDLDRARRAEIIGGLRRHLQDIKDRRVRLG